MYNLSAIEETSYLSVPNSKQYRMIMRIFFEEYEKMNFQLYKEDVLDKIRQQDEYKDYSMEQLLLDLEALVRWKNLTPIQDPGKVYTIAEYKNKQYRYVMSEYAVEIERMTVRLENLFAETGNLSTNLFGRIEYNLGEVEVLNKKSVQFVENNHMLQVYEGQSEAFGRERGSEVLYENTGNSKYFATNFSQDISKWSNIEDFENIQLEGVDSERGS